MKAMIEIANPYAAATALTTPLQQLYALMHHNDKHIRVKVAEHPHLPPPFLAELANDDYYEVRISVSEHTLTPLPILEMLAEDDHPDVRYALAENANTPPHILGILVKDGNPYVAARACKTLLRLQEQGIPETVLRCCA